MHFSRDFQLINMSLLLIKISISKIRCTFSTFHAPYFYLYRDRLFRLLRSILVRLLCVLCERLGLLAL